jgi:hypothetical protein
MGYARAQAVGGHAKPADVVRTLRLVASFALLGAVVVGIFAGSAEFSSFDPRWIGAAAGGAVAIAAKVWHAL